MTVRMISPYFLEYRLVAKYFALQLVLILCKLQPLAIQGIIGLIYTDCDITLLVLKNGRLGRLSIQI
jgi:organic solute transporter subunit alpha